MKRSNFMAVIKICGVHHLYSIFIHLFCILFCVVFYNLFYVLNYLLFYIPYSGAFSGFLTITESLQGNFGINGNYLEVSLCFKEPHCACPFI